MILKLFLILILLFIVKLFINNFNYKDYYFSSLSILILLFSYMFVMNDNTIFFIIDIILSLILVIYSYFYINSNDNSIIFINGNILFKSLLKNKYSINSLLSDLKKKNISYINNDICGILQDKKLVVYSKDILFDEPISLIVNGKINLKGLNQINKDERWLYNKINSIDILNIFYSFYYNHKIYIIKK